MRAAMRALLPDFSRLSLKSATGMMAEPAAPTLNKEQLLWNGLSQEDQLIVLNILHLRRMRLNMAWNQKADKEENFKTQENLLAQLPEWLSNRMKVTAQNREVMKNKTPPILPILWERALINRPEYNYLFESPEVYANTNVDSDDDDEENPRDTNEERFLDADERMMAPFQAMMQERFGRH